MPLRWCLPTALACLALTTTADAQGFLNPSYVTPRRTRGSYGPGMSFGEFGYRMNYGEAFGNVNGGLGRGMGYGGFGYGVGPGFGPNGSILYQSAYVTPGMNAGLTGFYPPFAAYGNNAQNPAVFPLGSPRPIPRPVYVPVRPTVMNYRPVPVVVRRPAR